MEDFHGIKDFRFLQAGRHDAAALGAAVGVVAPRGGLAAGTRAFEVFLRLTGWLAADNSRRVGNRLNLHGRITDGNLLGFRPTWSTGPGLSTGVALQPGDLNALRLVDRGTTCRASGAHGSLRASALSSLSTSLLRSTRPPGTLGSPRLLRAPGLRPLRSAGLTLPPLLLALRSLGSPATSLLLLWLPAGAARHLRVLVLLPSHLAIADVFVPRKLKLTQHSELRLLLGLLRGTIEQRRIGQRTAGRTHPRGTRRRGWNGRSRGFRARARRVCREAGASAKRDNRNTPETVVDKS